VVFPAHGTIALALVAARLAALLVLGLLALVVLALGP
jgi:hypothetical protein